MKANQKTELRRMGIGWFILKYAEDHGFSIGGVSTDYGTAKAMRTRLSAYERTKKEHASMINELKSVALRSSVKAGNPVLDVNQIQNILKKV